MYPALHSLGFQARGGYARYVIVKEYARRPEVCLDKSLDVSVE